MLRSSFLTAIVRSSKTLLTAKTDSKVQTVARMIPIQTVVEKMAIEAIVSL